MPRISTLAPLLALAVAPLFLQCMSPGAEQRLNRLEAKQDSILKILSTMKEQEEYVAYRVGWRPTVAADTMPKDIPIASSFFQGPEKAALTIVEFSDLQCPYCSQFAPTLDSLVKTYPNDIKVIFKNFPLSFHPQARSAAAAAIAAGKQGKFFEFRYKLAPSFRTLSDSMYLAVAKDIGLDLNRFKKEMALTPEVNQLLETDIALGRKVGVEGTPTIFVNGRLAQDRSFDYFVQLMRKAKG